MIAQEQCPLRVVRDRRRLGQDVDDREPVLHADGHEQTRHERKVKRHVALVALPEIGHRVFGPLVGLGEQHAVGVIAVHVMAQLAQEPVRLGQVLTVGALPLEEVRDRIEPDAVDADLHPEVEGLEDRLLDPRVVEVEVRLARVEAVPVVRVRDVVPGPVRRLEVFEDDPHVLVFLVGLAPHVEVARRRSRLRAARALKPRVLVRRVVAHELVDHPDATAVRFPDELVDVTQGAVHRVDVRVVRDVVPVVA